MGWLFLAVILPAIVFIVIGSIVGYFVKMGDFREALILQVGLVLILIGLPALLFVGLFIIYPIGLLIFGVGIGRSWRARELSRRGSL